MPTSTTTTPERGTIVADPEIVALNQCNKALAKLGGEAQVRIVTYLQAKYLTPRVPPSAKEAP